MKRWLILAMMGGALGGCAAMRKADSPVTMRLSPSFPAPAQARAGSVEVAPVQARGIAAAARYAYVDAAAPGEVRQAKSFSQIYNTAYDRLKGYQNINMSLTLESNRLGLQIQAFVRNLTNEDSVATTIQTNQLFGLFNSLFLVDPRTYGLRVTKRF